MRSANLPHNPRLDQLRCLAAGLVFLFHVFHYYYQHWQPASDRPWLGLLTEGHTGVGLFFTLSGFLFMQIALHHEQLNYVYFIRNRFLRIFPLFITVFVVAISIGRDRFNAQDLLYLFFSNLGQAPTSNTFITGAAWTISVEFTFYLVFPFLGTFAKQGGVSYLFRLLLLMLLFKLGAYLVTERSTHMLYSTLVGRFDQFLIGMLAAMLHRRYATRLTTSYWLLPGTTLLIIINSALQAKYASFFLPQPKQTFWIVWSMQEAGGWAVFTIAWLTSPLRLPARLEQLLGRGGEISYSFYLLHCLVIYLAYRSVGPVVLTGKVGIDGLFTALVLYLITWQVASLSYETIEKPFLSLRRRYGAGTSQQDAAHTRTTEGHAPSALNPAASRAE